MTETVSGSGFIVDWLFGGGGGGGNEDSVNLRSRSYLNCLLLLSEGEIRGFPVGEDMGKYIYINDTPIIAADGTPNYKGVTYEFRKGTPDQDWIAGSSAGIGNSAAVGVKVSKSNGAITRVITNTLATAIRLTLFSPQLSKQVDNKVRWSRVEFKIFLSTNGGPFIEQISDKFEGRSAGGYARDYTINVSKLAGPWTIKVERITDDVPYNKQQEEQNDLIWQSYTTIIEDRYRYPNSSVLWVRIDSAYIRGNPQISLNLMGIICYIPTNYNPITKTYSGLWDGTWTRGYTNNPVWALTEILTNSRFGTGKSIDLEQIDKWAFYKAAQYCDEMVGNGFGGLEPRFTHDCYYDRKEPADQIINGILSQIRAMGFYGNGQMMISQDRPTLTPKAIFTTSNTIRTYEDGNLIQPNFTYEYVSLKESRAKYEVYWYDPNEFDRRKIAYIDLTDVGYEDDFYRYGDEVKQIDLRGCKRESEALRYARWAILSERLEGQTVSFSTSDSKRLPGELITIADDRKDSVDGGVIMGVSGNQITLDRAITLESGITYQLLTLIEGNQAASTILNPAGTHTTITIDSDIEPVIGTPYVVAMPSKPHTYRILAISDKRDGTYGILAARYATDKYIQIDEVGELIASEGITPNPLPPDTISAQQVSNGYFVGWSQSHSTGVVAYTLEYSEENANRWTPIQVSGGQTSIQLTLPTDNYDFRVAAIDLWGRRSTWTYTGLVYPTSGRILEWLADGKIRLDSSINLLPNNTYYLTTTCEDPAGERPVDLPKPYQDTRKIITPSGTTDIIEVNPSYLGNKATLPTGNYPDLSIYGLDIGYLQFTYQQPPFSYTSITVGGGGGGSASISYPSIAIAYSQPNFAGTATTFYSSGLIYINQQWIKSIKILANTTALISQYPPGANPIQSSGWLLKTGLPDPDFTILWQSSEVIFGFINIQNQPSTYYTQNNQLIPIYWQYLERINTITNIQINGISYGNLLILTTYQPSLFLNPNSSVNLGIQWDYSTGIGSKTLSTQFDFVVKSLQNLATMMIVFSSGLANPKTIIINTFSSIEKIIILS